MELLHSSQYPVPPRVTSYKLGISVYVYTHTCVCTYIYTHILCFVTDIRESHLNISWKRGTQTYVLSNRFPLAVRAVLSQDSPQVTKQTAVINIKTYMIITEGRKSEMHLKILKCLLFGFPYDVFSVGQH